MTTWNRTSGDIGDTIVAYLYGVNTFSGATVVGHVWKTDVTSVDLTSSVVDGFDGDGVACGVCTTQLGSSSGWLKTASAGKWFLEHQVTFSPTVTITWPGRPDNSPDIIQVRAQGA